MARQPVRYDVQIEGWEELEAKLQSMAAEINSQEVLENALMDGGEIVRSAVQSQARQISNQGADSITISKQGREKYSIRIGPSGAGFFMRFFEYGAHMGGGSTWIQRPFMRPALDSVRVQAESAISDAIWRAVQEANR
jgi:HK97 gp10 family phage protein